MPMGTSSAPVMREKPSFIVHASLGAYGDLGTHGMPDLRRGLPCRPAVYTQGMHRKMKRVLRFLEKSQGLIPPNAFVNRNQTELQQSLIRCVHVCQIFDRIWSVADQQCRRFAGNEGAIIEGIAHEPGKSPGAMASAQS
jgi:hypothetical protein